MHIRHLAAGLLGVTALAACSDSTDPTFVNQAPQAFVRYVNASPDSPSLTIRLVDQVENWRTADGLAFRGNSGGYQAVNAGATRRLRAFRYLSTAGGLDTNTVVVLDTTIALEARAYYTIIQTGLVMGARGTAANTARIAVFTDTLEAYPDNSSLKVRAYHVAQGVGNVDVSFNKRAVIPAVAATPTAPAVPEQTIDSATSATRITNVAFGARSAYVTLPIVRLADVNNLYRFSIFPAGGTTALLAPRPNLPGVAASVATTTNPPLDAVAGVRIGQSVLSLFIFPAAVAGSPAATAATAAPTVDLIADRQPPRAT